MNRLKLYALRLSAETSLKWRVSFFTWSAASAVAALAMTLGYDSRVVLPSLLLIVPAIFLLFSRFSHATGSHDQPTGAEGQSVPPSIQSESSSRSAFKDSALDLLQQYAGFILALSIGIGTVIWNDIQRERFNEQIDALRKNNITLTSLNDDLFHQIFKTAPRKEGAARVSLRGCRSVGSMIECVLDLHSTLPLNIYLGRGTRIIDGHGNEHHAANGVAASGYSDDGGVSMGPGGLFLRGPLTFVIRFPGTKSDTRRIELLEMLSSEEDGLTVYQFHNIDLQG